MAGSTAIPPAVVIVQARLGSTRLPGKMLADLSGKPLLWHILQRARAVRPGLPVVLAIPDTTRDAPLGEVAAALGVAVVRGSETHVLDRYLLALRSHPARWVVRVCGDSPLFDPGHLDRCLALAENEQADVVKFEVDPGTLLQGGEVVSARALHLSRELAGNDPLATEHVTGWALRHAEEFPDLLRTAYMKPEPGLVLQRKLSVDTAQDLARMRALYAALWDGKGILDLKAAAAWLRGAGAGFWEETTL